MNCPVCNHPALVEYNTVPSVCPNCNSDLKGFLLINTIEKEGESKLRRYKVILAGFSIVLMFILFGSILLMPSILKHINKEKSIQQFDSTNYYKELVVDLKQELSLKSRTADICYIIKRNDNLSEIAKLFYNDASRTKQIMTDNNLQKGYNLLPGDTLIIKINSQ